MLDTRHSSTVEACVRASARERCAHRVVAQRWGRRPGGWSGIALLLWTALLQPAVAQTTPPRPPGRAPDDPVLRFVTPPVVVTAQKEPEDSQKLPVSVTAVSGPTLSATGIRLVSEAALLAPNTMFTEASARKLSSARVRGVGASPNNAGIVTSLDGVPMLHANPANLELLDVDQVEFVRGPQSALFGRNALGGVVSVASARPSLAGWTGSVAVPVGNHGTRAIRASLSGPLATGRLGIAAAFARTIRDGFAVNDATGRRLDDRSDVIGKVQVLWKPAGAWEARAILTGERARDGDYAFADLEALQARPFRAARDYVGRVERDVLGTTLHVRRTGEHLTVSSITGVYDWRTRDRTDLDYTAHPLARRDNTERGSQVTQELRLASAGGPVDATGRRAGLRWQSGLFAFAQSYRQEALNAYAPFVVAPFAVTQRSPWADIHAAGLGVFGQVTLTVKGRLDLAAGGRLDHERTRGTVDTAFDPPLAPRARVAATQHFSNLSPQVSAIYRATPSRSVYATVGRGYKAGGMNPAAPAGRETYGEESSWNVEAGTKLRWAAGRVSTTAAVFRIDWSEMQLDVPNPAVPAQFYLANVGDAVSRGAEVELRARMAPGLDLFTAFGYTDARFSPGTRAGGSDVGNNRIPYTPGTTFSAGVHYAATLGGWPVSARADVVHYGSFRYDERNSRGQDAYTLAHVRVAVEGRRYVADVMVRNALDTRYTALALPYPGLASSGFIGELGPPRTVTASAGLRF